MSLTGYREGEPKSTGPIKQHGFKAMGQKQRNKPKKFIYEFCIVSLCKMKYGGCTTDPKALEFQLFMDSLGQNIWNWEWFRKVLNAHLL